jgi:hypothetical protein
MITFAAPVERGFRTVGPFKGPAIIDYVGIATNADSQHAHYWCEVLTSFDTADGRLPNGTRIFPLTQAHALLPIYDQEAGGALGQDLSPLHVYHYVPHSTWYLALCGRTTIPGTILGQASAWASWLVLDPEHTPTPQPRPTPRPTPTPTPPTTPPPTTPPTTTPTTTPTTPPTTTPAPQPRPTTPPARPLYITQLPPVVYRTPDGSWRTGAGVRPYSGGILIRTAVALLALSLSLAACTTHVTGPLWQTPHNANTSSSFDGRGEPTPRPLPANHEE